MSTRGFYGREGEVECIRRAWNECAAAATKESPASGPRMVLVIGETGLGKSRLIQALYEQLTTDPIWDPTEYWPDAMQALSGQLRVNPDLSGHVPGGPPRFLWLGMRWQPPAARNVDERSCQLPEARDALRAHVTIAQRNASVWIEAASKLKRAIAAQGAEEVASQVADAVLPFGGLLVKLAKSTLELARERSEGPRRVDAERARQVCDASDELQEELREVLGGTGRRRPLPTVLWLDDAQWADEMSLRCLHEVWGEARAKKWPLLVLVTHWEREWRELEQMADGRSPICLTRYDGFDVDRIWLPRASMDGLSGYLRAALPGLTTEQASALVDRSGGNFLSMVENVTELTQEPRWFEHEDPTQALTPEGLEHIQAFASNREQRVRQRFKEFERKEKDALGWAAHLGSRFLADLLEDIVRAKVPDEAPRALVDRCVSPLAVLAAPSVHAREFRDRAFFDAAAAHYAAFLRRDEPELVKLLTGRVCEWIDGEGGEPKASVPSPPGAVEPLEPADRLVVLELARQLLPLGGNGQVHDRASQALRARYLLIVEFAGSVAWSDVRRVARELSSVDWSRTGEEVLGKVRLDILGKLLGDAGVYDAASEVLSVAVRLARTEFAQPATPEQLKELALSLRLLASIRDDTGMLDQAAESYAEHLAVLRELATSCPPREVDEDLAFGINACGVVRLQRGERAIAAQLFQESLALYRAMDARKSTATTKRDVAGALNNLVAVHLESGDAAACLPLLEEALALEQQSAHDDPQGNARDISTTLNNLGAVHERLGNHERAAVLLDESVRLSRARALASPTVESELSLAIGVINAAVLQADRRDSVEAQTLLDEAMSLCRPLASVRTNLKAVDALADALFWSARLAADRGDDDTAGSLTEECVELRRASAQRKTPHALWELARALSQLAAISIRRAGLHTGRPAFEECVAVRESLLGTHYGSAVHVELRRGLLEYAGLCEAEGELELAHRCLQHQTLTSAEDGLGPTTDQRRELCALLQRIGNRHFERMEFSEAATVLACGVEALRCLPAAERTRDDDSQVALMLNDLAAAQARLSDYDGALQLLEESLEMRRTLVAKHRVERTERAVATTLRNIADVHQERGDVARALDVYEEAIELLRSAATIFRSSRCEEALAEITFCVGRIHLLAVRVPEAIPFLEESLATRRSLVERGLRVESTVDLERDAKLLCDLKTGNLRIGAPAPPRPRGAKRSKPT